MLDPTQVLHTTAATGVCSYSLEGLAKGMPTHVTLTHMLLLLSRRALLQVSSNSTKPRPPTTSKMGCPAVHRVPPDVKDL